MAKKKAVEGEKKKSVTKMVKEWLAVNSSATVPEIIAHFAQEGVTVSVSNARKIMYTRGADNGPSGKAKRRKRKAKAAKAVAKSSTGRKAGRPKKLARGEKAARIRALWTDMGRKTRPKNVLARAVEQGLTATFSEVVGVRDRLWKKRKKRKAQVAESNGVVHRAPKAAVSLSLEVLIDVRNFAKKIGGPDVVKQALSALAALSN